MKRARTSDTGMNIIILYTVYDTDDTGEDYNTWREGFQFFVDIPGPETVGEVILAQLPKIKPLAKCIGGCTGLRRIRHLVSDNRANCKVYVDLDTQMSSLSQQGVSPMILKITLEEKIWTNRSSHDAKDKTRYNQQQKFLQQSKCQAPSQ